MTYTQQAIQNGTKKLIGWYWYTYFFGLWIKDTEL